MTSPLAAIRPADVPLDAAVRRYLFLLGNIDAVLTSVPLWLARIVSNTGTRLVASLLGPSLPLARVWDEAHPFGRLRFYLPAGPPPALPAAAPGVVASPAMLLAEAVAGHVDEVLRLRPRAVWLQLGVRDPGSAARWCAAGIDVVQDRCVKIDLGLL